MTTTTELIKQLKDWYMWQPQGVREDKTRSILGLEETPYIVYWQREGGKMYKTPKDCALAIAKKKNKRVFQFLELPENHVLTNNAHDIKILLKSGFREVK